MGIMHLKTIFIACYLSFMVTSIQAQEIKIIETDDAEVEVRVFPAEGSRLLLGFPIEEGKSLTEEKIASSLAEDGIEVWMPDVLSALMLPNVKSSLKDIPSELLIRIIDEAGKSGKSVYLIASGQDAEVVLRSASEWERLNKTSLAGAVLMFPRLFKEAPEPGEIPEYVDSVGKTKLPIMLLEGGRTPNRWGVKTLSHALQENGSPVVAKIIPQIRGKFFKRDDSNRSEEVVASQMAGLIKVSLFYLSNLCSISEIVPCKLNKPSSSL